MVLPLLPIIAIVFLAMLIIFAIILIIGYFWVSSHPVETAILALLLAFIVFAWKFPKQRKKLLHR